MFDVYKEVWKFLKKIIGVYKDLFAYEKAQRDKDHIDAIAG